MEDDVMRRLISRGMLLGTIAAALPLPGLILSTFAPISSSVGIGYAWPRLRAGLGGRRWRSRRADPR
jgi:hypothetical protein